jgi:hypothetical protein
MPASRTRFSFTLKGGRKVELFSVREKANNDLIVLIRQAKNRGYRDDEGQRYNEFRFSVHCSPSSPGYTITFIERQASGESERGHSYFTPINGQYSWPLIGYIATHMAEDHYTLTQGASDQVVNVGGYNPKLSTLIYFIIISDKDTDLSAMPLPSGELFRSKCWDFKNFRLWILHAFLNIPSITVGSHTMIATAEPEVNGVRGRLLNENANGFNNTSLQHMLYTMMEQFSGNIISNHRLVGTDRDQKIREMIDHFSRIYVRAPIMPQM